MAKPKQKEISDKAKTNLVACILEILKQNKTIFEPELLNELASHGFADTNEIKGILTFLAGSGLVEIQPLLLSDRNAEYKLTENGEKVREKIENPEGFWQELFREQLAGLDQMIANAETMKRQLESEQQAKQVEVKNAQNELNTIDQRLESVKEFIEDLNRRKKSLADRKNHQAR